MTLDEAREYVVIVNEGSGCFFQPANPDETYILTAKHNIENADNQIKQLVRFKYQNDSFKSFEIEIDELIEGENYLPHPEIDIAIIKIARIDNLDNLFRIMSSVNYENNFSLYGYPNKRRVANPDSKVNWFRPEDGVELLGTLENSRKEAKIPGNPDHSEMLGHSGGIICKRTDRGMFIAGIQNGMVKADEEDLGRIEFTPINYFDEIVEEYDISPLHPSYLSNFSFLVDKSFDLRASFGQDDINYTKEFLKYKANEVVKSDITPLFIRDFFKERLLISESQKEDIDREFIWIIWLEFLTILNLVKGKIHSEKELEEIFNNHRLLYSKTKNDWAEELDKIIHSDYKGLKRNGLVIIGTEKSPDNNVFIIDKTIPLITSAKKTIDRDQLKIDEGMGYPLEEYTFIHFDYFKKGCISLRHEEYVEILDDQKALEKLTSLYNDFFE